VALHRRIVVYGSSLILGGIGARLAREPGVQLTYLSPPLPGASDLEVMATDVVLFDVEHSSPDAAFSLFATRLGLVSSG
jgi:hypothetical protein